MFFQMLSVTKSNRSKRARPDGDHCRKPQATKAQSCGAKTQQIHMICSTTPTLKTQASLWKTEESAEKQEVCCDTASPRKDRGATPIKSHQCGCHDLSRNSSNRHASVEGGEKEKKQLRNPEIGRDRLLQGRAY